jgi:hypothetical protein
VGEGVLEADAGAPEGALSHEVSLISRRHRRHRVGSVLAPLLDGEPVLKGFEVAGAFQSPWRPGLWVLVVTFSRRGWEGPPDVDSFQLVGVALD